MSRRHAVLLASIPLPSRSMSSRISALAGWPAITRSTHAAKPSGRKRRESVRMAVLPLCVDSSALVSVASIASMRADIVGLDDRPPFLDFRFLICPECFRRLLLAGWDVLPQVSEPLAHLRIGQGIHNRSIELGDNAAGCVLRHPERVPNRNVEH